jgi:crotonobetainyl-CoA:carnitine CoA-transferase CaiB-like acyl-CoA transferase
MGDTVTGYLLMGEICAALYRRKDTGLGDYVKAGLYHNTLFAMGNMMIITQPPFGRVFPTDRASWGAPS